MSPEEMGPSASSRPPTTPPYEVASRQTGQSDPKSRRPAPNQSTTDATNGRRSAGVHEAQFASVTIPDSFSPTLGGAASPGTRSCHSGYLHSPTRGLTVSPTT